MTVKKAATDEQVRSTNAYVTVTRRAAAMNEAAKKRYEKGDVATNSLLAVVLQDMTSPKKINKIAKALGLVKEEVVLPPHWQKIISEQQKILSKAYGVEVEIKDPPEYLVNWLTEEKMAECAKINWKMAYRPNKTTDDIEGVRPDSFFEENVANGNIKPFNDIHPKQLETGWMLIEITQMVDWEKQIIPNDPIGQMIEDFRKSETIGKYDDTKLQSRFSIRPDSEWPLIFKAVADKLQIPKQATVRHPRANERNLFGNTIPELRETFDCWEWYADDFSDGDRLVGCYRGDGGLADVHCSWHGYRDQAFAGRLSVSFR